MGRPHKFTAKQVADALKQTKGMVYLAAEVLGCDPTTIYNYAEKFPTVKAQFQTQRGRIVDTAELKLVQAVMNGEAWAVKFALETIGRDRGYGHKIEIEGLAEVLEYARSRGIPASEMFNAFLQELAESDVSPADRQTSSTTPASE